MNVVLQDGIKDCGVCCLLSIIRFYGGDVSKEYLRELTNTTKEGVSLYYLIEAAKKLGFEAIGVTGKFKDIHKDMLPCIVHFTVNKSYKHFVVLYQINEKKRQVTLMDPAKGKKIISFSEFQLLSSSVYLLLKPVKKIPIMKKKHIIYSNIKLLFQKNKKLLLFIFLLTLSYFVMNFFTTFHLKYILELSVNYEIKDSLLWISTLMIILYLLKNSMFFLQSILLSKWMCLFDFETTCLTYKQILLLPYLYYKNRTTGEILSRLKDLNVIRSFISNCFCVFTTDLVSLILFFILMIKYHLSISFMISLIFIFFLFFNLITISYKKKLIQNISNSGDIVHSYFIHGISNVDTTKGSHLEKYFIDKFSFYYRTFLEKNYHYNWFLGVYEFMKRNVHDFILILLYGFGSYYVIQKKLSFSNFILYQTLFSYFQHSFYNLLSVMENYSSYKVALERVEEIFMIHRDNFQNNYYYLPYRLNGNIVFSDLCYQVGSKKLFQHLDLTIKQGEKILLSGESGCGKSTLLKMLCRYVDVDYHHLSICDIDINHYHLENIRSFITYVTSSEYLYTDTLRNNILMYKDVPLEKFQEACKICYVDEIAQNSMIGYDTLIEENGFNFSNGERQRIVLARSIIRDSTIYIFDEAFSGIDIQKEKLILENIFRFLKNKTVIVISHRFNNKKLFDRILKLEDGVIHENT